MTLRPRSATAAWAGPARLQIAGAVVRLASAAVPGTPLYVAGVERGDQIVSLGGAAIDSQAAWDRALQQGRPGEETDIRFIQRGMERSARLRFANDPAVELVRTETAGGQVTADQLAFREAWLGAATE